MDKIFLKISTLRGVIRFEKRGNSSPKYIGPLLIIKRIRVMAYCNDPTINKYTMMHLDGKIRFSLEL